jgi:abortive infection bacteriophage resistance protein
MSKPFLTLEQQRQLLARRGLTLTLDADTERLLYSSNYYRLSGYGRQFQEDPRAGLNDFVAGASLGRIQELTDLDALLRRLLVNALASVEIVLRSRFAYEAGKVHGQGAFYLLPENYLAITKDLPRFISKIESELRRPKLITVARYRNGADLSSVPIWVAIELISFGGLARMIQYLGDPTAARSTAQSLSLTWTGFQSSVHAFAVLRNTCAHHGQLWHRKLDISAPTLKKDKRRERAHAPQSVYATIVALKRYVSAVDPAHTFPDELDDLLDSDPEFAAGICFPAPA